MTFLKTNICFSSFPLTGITELVICTSEFEVTFEFLGSVHPCILSASTSERREKYAGHRRESSGRLVALLSFILHYVETE